jgi:hypothetical protein
MTNDLMKAAIDALRPFAACCEQIDPNEDGEEWAKFRLLIGDYRRAASALAALEKAQAGEGVATALLDRAELAWQRFFYPAADCFAGPAADKLPAVDLEVADCLRLVLASVGRLVVTPEADVPAPLPTLQRLGQEFDAGEVKASFKAALADLGKGDAVQWQGTEDSQHAERMKACKARCQRWGDCDEGDGSCAECDSDMAEALETTESMKRRLRNYESRIDRFFQSDGLRAVQSALAHPPQSRGQAVDGEGEARTYHADDCEAMQRPRADCTCAPMIVTPAADAEMRKLLDLIETADEHGDECAIVEQAAAVRQAIDAPIKQSLTTEKGSENGQ